MRARMTLLWGLPLLLTAAFASWFGCTTMGPMVPSDPRLSVSPNSLSFLYDDDPKRIDVSNQGGGTLDWSVSESDDYGWVSCAPTSGTVSGRGFPVEVSIDWSTLDYGASESGWLVVLSSAGAETISLAASRPGTSSVSREPSHLNIMYPFPQTSTFEIWNGGTGVLHWEVVEPGGGYDWLSCSPSDGHSSGERDVVDVHIRWNLFSVGESKHGCVYLRELFASPVDSVSIMAWRGPLGRP